MRQINKKIFKTSIRIHSINILTKYKINLSFPKNWKKNIKKPSQNEKAFLF